MVFTMWFLTTQSAYDAAVVPLFETLDWLEARLESAGFFVWRSQLLKPIGGCSRH